MLGNLISPLLEKQVLLTASPLAQPHLSVCPLPPPPLLLETSSRRVTLAGLDPTVWSRMVQTQRPVYLCLRSTEIKGVATTLSIKRIYFFREKFKKRGSSLMVRSYNYKGSSQGKAQRRGLL